jgi:hypothetical protein
MLQNVAVEACTAAWGVCRHRESFFSLIWRVWDLLYLRWCWDEFKMSLKWFDWDVCVWIWCGWCDIFEFWILNWAPSLLIVQVQKRPAAEQRISAAEQSIYMSAVALKSLHEVGFYRRFHWAHSGGFKNGLNGRPLFGPDVVCVDVLQWQKFAKVCHRCLQTEALSIAPAGDTFFVPMPCHVSSMWALVCRFPWSRNLQFFRSSPKDPACLR